MKLAWDSEARTERVKGRYERRRSDDPYHSFRWTRLSRVFRESHPLCAECARKGIIKEAECVDHIIPWPVCMDFFNADNLQSLCAECNMLKGIKDRELIRKWKLSNKASQ